ncbi:regulatory-associated protein of mTOR [Acrasis kona]|uniref:Regulatory-associated protein of mTOR n=1 Tax=Acrasis kona TaxID=1008807 RepID=A0AAW2ZFM6_9EUKA
MSSPTNTDSFKHGRSFKESRKQRIFLEEERHNKDIDKDAEDKELVVDWRMKQRLKTAQVALVMCLNIGVDPPDVIKVLPCAKLECWIDPFTLPQQKALETIGAQLKTQYERWQPRARYKQCLDPTVDDVKKTCTSLRRSAKKERILFHYNGHGVPRPTTNGEIWVFNKNFTQYIPLLLWDLYVWMDSPSIYVFDCNNAGLIVKSFTQIIKQKDKEDSKNNPNNTYRKHKENILLAACSANESLPLNPKFPADLFTACLTTPIRVALQWFCQNNRLVDGITIEMIDRLPGRVNDRRTPLGELNWIFTAVTDTIAWSVLPRELFHKLFRQDLLVASLFSKLFVGR